MGDPDGTVIPSSTCHSCAGRNPVGTKAGIQNKKFMALALATGLLVLMGAGCTKNQSTLQPDEDDSFLNSLKTEIRNTQNFKIAGVDLVCDKENAKVLHPEADWTKIEQGLSNLEKDGWKIQKFCFDDRAFGHEIFFMLSKGSENDVPLMRFGFYGENLGLKVSEEVKAQGLFASVGSMSFQPSDKNTRSYSYFVRVYSTKRNEMGDEQLYHLYEYNLNTNKVELVKELWWEPSFD